MSNLKVQDVPDNRVAIGQAVLAAAKCIDAKPVKTRLTAFERAHKEYLAAELRLAKAEAARRRKIGEVAERDVEQDEAVMALASALTVDGLPGQNPFKPLGFESPSEVARLSYEREARVVGHLAKIVEQRKIGARSVEAARRMAKIAEAVVHAIDAVRPLDRARREALAVRDRLEQPWETALASLKAGARADKDLFGVLFEGKVVKGRAKKKKK